MTAAGAGTPIGSARSSRTCSRTRSSTAGAGAARGKAARVSLQIDGSPPDIVHVRVHNAGAIPAELITRMFDPMIAGNRPRDGSRGAGAGPVHHPADRRGARRLVDVYRRKRRARPSRSPCLATPTWRPSASPRREPLPRERARRRRRRWPPPSTRATARFRLLVEAVKDYAIFMLDPTGRVATWNAGAERIKGYDAPTRSSASTSRASTDEEVRARQVRARAARSPRARAASRTRAGACARTARSSGPTW